MADYVIQNFTFHTRLPHSTAANTRNPQLLPTAEKHMRYQRVKALVFGWLLT
jgi:hypothetical protein